LARGVNRRRERLIQRRATCAFHPVRIGRRRERVKDGLVPDRAPAPSGETSRRRVEHLPDNVGVNRLVSARESSLQKRGSVKRTGRSAHRRDEGMARGAKDAARRPGLARIRAGDIVKHGAESMREVVPVIPVADGTIETGQKVAMPLDRSRAADKVGPRCSTVDRIARWSHARDQHSRPLLTLGRA